VFPQFWILSKHKVKNHKNSLILKHLIIQKRKCQRGTKNNFIISKRLFLKFVWGNFLQLTFFQHVLAWMIVLTHLILFMSQIWLWPSFQWLHFIFNGQTFITEKIFKQSLKLLSIIWSVHSDLRILHVLVNINWLF
jgi:hypothetical protein